MPRSQTQQRNNPKDRSAQKPAQKRKNGRSLNALSIAEKQIPTRLGVRRSRLGAYDDGSSRKRNTGGDDEDEEEETPHYKRRRTEDTGSLDGGSDSEGHEWTLGQVNSDDDSELDSDEALGESDEERFEGFTFRASKSKNAPKKAAPKPKKPVEINLDEDDEQSEEDSDDEDEDEDEDDDLGEDAVDLATAWDMNTAAEEEDAKEAAKKAKRAARDDDSEEDSGSEADSESDTSEDGLSASDDDDEVDPHGLSKLQDFVQSMETGKSTKRTQKSQEQGKPSEYGLTSSNKLTVADLLPSITDSRLKNSLKHIDSVVQSSKSGIPGKLDAPLAKRQQDRIDRTAAYEKSKETLNRWLDTVKANRRAEHLSFPLRDPDAEQSHRLEVTKPQTDLESAIQNILVESGLAEAEGKTAEDQIQDFEELQARNIPVEEIQARRAELRKRRDLLFREEVRAKRIKKIKSKSYRRVHRKEREKEEQQERQALMEAGVDPDGMDQEKSERLRAEARMGSKHRDSKWAKGLKQTGRTAWDEDARNSAADLAQREEELRKRIEGKRVSTGDDDYLGSSSSESEEEEDPWNEQGSDVEREKFQKKLSALEGNDNSGAVKGPHADLFEMKFMKNADAARKAQNDAELRQLKGELHGDEAQSDADSEVGRRKFGQSKKDDSKSRTKQLPKNEFEEKLDSDDEDAQVAESNNDMDIVVDQPTKQQSGARGTKNVSQASRKFSNEKEAPEEAPEEENPWLVQTERTNRRRTGPDAQEDIDISLDAAQPELATAKTQSKKPKNAKTALSKKQFDEDNDSDDEDSVPVLLKNHDLVKRAFAGDEVVQDFEQDKMDTIEDEGDKIVDNTLQGWGSWAGEGVSKRQLKKQKRDLTTVAGVKPQQRKDAKLDRVIINQKRIQKVRDILFTLQRGP
jgi:U3 small nucleolar RNA-associated protein 14